MKEELPEKFKEKILQMPEYRQGVTKIKVWLKDGRSFASGYVAWGSEIVKVGDSTRIPFPVSEITEVDNDL